VLLIEMGIPFVLYMLWWMTHGPGNRAVDRFMAIFPITYAALIFLVTDTGSTDVIAMRGFVPAQLCIVLLGLQYLDEWWSSATTRRRVVSGYLFAVALLPQLVWPAEELRWLSVDSIGSAAHTGGEVHILHVLVASEAKWPERLNYIHWANRSTPVDSVFIELGLTDEYQDQRFKYLERTRWLPPQLGTGVICPECNLNLSELRGISSGGSTDAVIEQAIATGKLLEHRRPIYVVVRGPNAPSHAALAYQDQRVTVYKIDTDWYLQSP
jgi:hypothetical protein